MVGDAVAAEAAVVVAVEGDPLEFVDGAVEGDPLAVVDGAAEGEGEGVVPHELAVEGQFRNCSVGRLGLNLTVNLDCILSIDASDNTG